MPHWGKAFLSHGLRSKRCYHSVAVTPATVRILYPRVAGPYLLARPRTFHLALVLNYNVCRIYIPYQNTFSIITYSYQMKTWKGKMIKKYVNKKGRK